MNYCKMSNTHAFFALCAAAGARLAAARHEEYVSMVAYANGMGGMHTDVYTVARRAGWWR